MCIIPCRSPSIDSVLLCSHRYINFSILHITLHYASIISNSEHETRVTFVSRIRRVIIWTILSRCAICHWEKFSQIMINIPSNTISSCTRRSKPSVCIYTSSCFLFKDCTAINLRSHFSIIISR